MKYLVLCLKHPFISILLLTGGLLTLLLIFGRRPSTGTIHQNLSAAEIKKIAGTSSASESAAAHLNQLYYGAQNAEQRQEARPGVFEGQYFRLNYPSDYTIKEHDRGRGTELEKLILVTAGPFSDHVTISISTTNIAKLDEVASVALRLKNPDAYQESPVAVDGQSGLVFESTSDGYEKIAFVLSKGRLTTVAFITSGDKDTKDALGAILSGFEWK